MIRLLLINLLAFVFSIAQAADNPAAELFTTINLRLSYMQEVALYKAQQQLPIEDIPREQLVIVDAKIAAAELGLNPESMEDFFAAQIAVAKAIQYRYREQLLSEPSQPPAQDLDSEIRPVLTQLGDRIVQLIAGQILTSGPLGATDWNAFDAAIDTNFVSPADKRLLFDALILVRAR